MIGPNHVGTHGVEGASSDIAGETGGLVAEKGILTSHFQEPERKVTQLQACLKARARQFATMNSKKSVKAGEIIDLKTDLKVIACKSELFHFFVEVAKSYHATLVAFSAYWAVWTWKESRKCVK